MAEQIKSQSITNADASPIVPNSAGQGAGGRRVTVQDQVACTAAGLNAAKSIYRLVRIPTAAIIENVVIATDTGLDTGTHALAMDFNVVWSDSTRDGTPQRVIAAAGEAVIPTTANDGATVTSVAAYAAPNLLFGTKSVSPASAALAPVSILFNGVTATYTMLMITQQPLYETFGFVDGRGNPADPGGYFDIMAYISTPAGTGAPGNLYCRVMYLI